MTSIRDLSDIFEKKKCFFLTNKFYYRALHNIDLKICRYSILIGRKVVKFFFTITEQLTWICMIQVGDWRKWRTDWRTNLGFGRCTFWLNWNFSGSSPTIDLRMWAVIQVMTKSLCLANKISKNNNSFDNCSLESPRKWSAVLLYNIIACITFNFKTDWKIINCDIINNDLWETSFIIYECFDRFYLIIIIVLKFQ